MSGMVERAGREGILAQIACPLAGREVPDLPEALAPRLAMTRIIPHRAGLADLEQLGADFDGLRQYPGEFSFSDD